MKNRIALYRILAVAIPLALIELACRIGWMNRLTLPPPSEMVVGLYGILASGRMNAAILETLRNVLEAFAGSVVVGVALGAAIHRIALVRRLLEPLFSTWYAVPIYAFYPLLIVMFGLGDRPEILIGFMLAVVAVITATLGGLDNVPQVLIKTARVVRATAGPRRPGSCSPPPRPPEPARSAGTSPHCRGCRRRSGSRSRARSGS